MTRKSVASCSHISKDNWITKRTRGGLDPNGPCHSSTKELLDPADLAWTGPGPDGCQELAGHSLAVEEDYIILRETLPVLEAIRFDTFVLQLTMDLQHV